MYVVNNHVVALFSMVLVVDSYYVLHTQYYIHNPWSDGRRNSEDDSFYYSAE